MWYCIEHFDDRVQDIYIYIMAQFGHCIFNELVWITLYSLTVQCCYNAVNFLQNTHNRRPIAHPRGWGMGCFLWVQSEIYVLLLSSQTICDTMIYWTVIKAPNCVTFSQKLVIFWWHCLLIFTGSFPWWNGSMLDCWLPGHEIDPRLLSAPVSGACRPLFLSHWLLVAQLLADIFICCQNSNISHTLVANKLADRSDLDGALPVGAAPTTSSFST